jgi:hypothetical protein
MDQNEIWHDPRHLGVLSCASKMIYETVVCSVQTVLLNCVKINTVSKQTKTSFHLSLVPLEYCQVRPKWFLSLWYIWRKPCGYLVPTLTPSPNGPKQASTWASSPRSTIGWVRNDSWAYGMFGANHAPILHDTNTIYKWTGTRFDITHVT